jgi:hypothetical protein
MEPAPDRWELGSLFHLADYAAGGERGPCPWDAHDRVLVGCGRDALRLVVGLGRYRRIWIPSYFCQEVVRAFEEPGLALACYRDSPLEPMPRLADLPLAPGDAVFVMNYFGLRRPPAAPLVELDGVEVIEDHTHAPTSAWALGSTADFCVASLRKLFPLADGGVVWSPRGHVLPPAPPVTEPLRIAALDKLSGMILKALHLAGHDVDKAAFRALLARGEDALYTGAPSGMTEVARAMLATCPLATWRRVQRDNFAAFARHVPELPGVHLARPTHPDDVPFSAFVTFDDEGLRDRVHRALVAQRVYASLLWPLDAPRLPGVPDAHRRLARCSFSVPIDMRYRPADLERAGRLLAQALAGA